jgi:hypothetical protein
MPKVIWAMTMVGMPRPRGQPIACSSATNQRAGRGQDRDLEADKRGMFDLIVLPELAIPLGREAGPDSDEARGIEGIDDDGDDRPVEKDEAERHHQGEKGREPVAHARSPVR